MGNVIVRNQNPGTATKRDEWDPMRWARDLFRFDPFREMMAPLPVPELGFTVAFEVKETENAYLFRADVPGIAEKDLEITHTGNRLAVTGKREADREEKGETYYVAERTYGTFTRAFTLPDGVDLDHVRADLKEGVLTIMVPKRPETQPRKIPLGNEDKKM